jgi:mRNA interferase RelE/StbE
MIYYSTEVQKAISKGDVPRETFRSLHNAFLSIDLTKDLNLFDIKQMKGNYDKKYFRMRKGKFRSIFYIDSDDIYVIYIGKREEVYDLWQ